MKLINQKVNLSSSSSSSFILLTALLTFNASIDPDKIDSKLEFSIKYNPITKASALDALEL
jgi:hypothetical protein